MKATISSSSEALEILRVLQPPNSFKASVITSFFTWSNRFDELSLMTRVGLNTTDKGSVTSELCHPASMIRTILSTAAIPMFCCSTWTVDKDGQK